MSASNKIYLNKEDWEKAHTKLNTLKDKFSYEVGYELEPCLCEELDLGEDNLAKLCHLGTLGDFWLYIQLWENEGVVEELKLNYIDSFTPIKSVFKQLYNACLEEISEELEFVDDKEEFDKTMDELERLGELYFNNQQLNKQMYGG